MDVKWIKIVTNIFDDEKLLLIESLPDADSIIVIWFKLLCLAGKQNNGGVFIMANKIPYTEEMLATIFRRPLNTVRLALATFEKYGMIEIYDGIITIPNWDKHQSLDSYEKKKEYDRQYQAGRRARLREASQLPPACEASNDKSCDASYDVVPKIREEEKREDKTKKKGFVKPSLEEVQSYISKMGYHFSAEAFIAYYESNGWHVGRNPMKSWMSACTTWEVRENKTAPGKNKTMRMSEMPNNQVSPLSSAEREKLKRSFAG